MKPKVTVDLFRDHDLARIQFEECFKKLGEDFYHYSHEEKFLDDEQEAYTFLSLRNYSKIEIVQAIMDAEQYQGVEGCLPMTSYRSSKNSIGMITTKQVSKSKYIDEQLVSYSAHFQRLIIADVCSCYEINNTKLDLLMYLFNQQWDTFQDYGFPYKMKKNLAKSDISGSSQGELVTVIYDERGVNTQELNRLIYGAPVYARLIIDGSDYYPELRGYPEDYENELDYESLVEYFMDSIDDQYTLVQNAVIRCKVTRKICKIKEL